MNRPGFSDRIMEMGCKPDGEVLAQSCAALDGHDARLLLWITDRALSEEKRFALGVRADSLPRMSHPRILRYFKSSPEIIRLAVMIHVPSPLPLRARCAAAARVWHQCGTGRAGSVRSTGRSPSTLWLCRNAEPSSRQRCLSAPGEGLSISAGAVQLAAM